MPITKRQAADVQNTALAQAQGRQLGGITPEGVIEITENGTYDVTVYASAEVNVSGGGGVPISISKIDGGSFTPTADGRCDIIPITHNLGERPAGFVVWTDELDDFQSASRIYVVTIFGERKTFEQAGGASSYGVLSYANRTTEGSVGTSNILLSETQATVTFTDTQFKFLFDNRYYKANTTYKWIAWA